MPLLIAILLLAPSARADFASGKRAYAAGDYAAAYRQWLPLAKSGDAAAQMEIGWLYGEGLGRPRDQARAVFWLRKAARQANTMALHLLGYLYDTGDGLPKDAARAACCAYPSGCCMGRPSRLPHSFHEPR